MFTGLIEATGKIAGVERHATALKIAIEHPWPVGGLALGDSVAVDGTCLTVTEIKGSRFVADISHETAKRSTLAEAAIGRQVNLERALQVGSRLGGHIVQGHVDGIGRIARIVEQGGARDLVIEAERPLLRYVVEKGSIAVDGVSLTVSSLSPQGFTLTLIPHSLSLTTLHAKRVGERVNLEVDILAKYVERLLGGVKPLSAERLAELGFTK